MGLDGVELVLAVEQTFGIAIPDAAAAGMTTPAMMISYVQAAIRSHPDRKACISLRAFHRVRASLMKATGAPRSEITLDRPIKELFAGSEGRNQWEAFRIHSSITCLPSLGFGTAWIWGPKTVGDLVSIAISAAAAELRDQQIWTDEEARQIIRNIISEQLGIRRFSDTDDFVRDLGVG
jgi:acyl carrier protein